MKSKIRYLLCFCSCLAFLWSCNSSIEFTDYKKINHSIWGVNDTISFKFNIQDTLSKKNAFIHVRNTNAYAFNNLYVITKLIHPNNLIEIDTLHYKMADDNGKLLGTGISSLKENKLFYKEKKVFPNKGVYTFAVYQAMRKQGDVNPTPIKGVKEVGFSIEK